MGGSCTFRVTRPSLPRTCGWSSSWHRHRPCRHRRQREQLPSHRPRQRCRHRPSPRCRHHPRQLCRHRRSQRWRRQARRQKRWLDKIIATETIKSIYDPAKLKQGLKNVSLLDLVFYYDSIATLAPQDERMFCCAYALSPLYSIVTTILPVDLRAIMAFIAAPASARS